MNLQIGDVVLVRDLVDSRGSAPKTRPVVVVCETEPSEGTFLGVAVSTQFQKPLAPMDVLLFDGKIPNRTGLRKPCVAVCNWILQIEVEKVDRKLGHVFPHQLKEIIERISRQID